MTIQDILTIVGVSVVLTFAILIPVWISAKLRSARLTREMRAAHDEWNRTH